MPHRLSMGRSLALVGVLLLATVGTSQAALNLVHTWDKAMIAAMSLAPGTEFQVNFTSTACYECASQHLVNARYNVSSVSLPVTTSWPIDFHFIVNDTVLATSRYTLGEHGHYLIEVSATPTGQVVSRLVTLIKPGKSIYIPIAVALSILAGAALAYVLLRKAYQKLTEEHGHESNFYGGEPLLSPSGMIEGQEYEPKMKPASKRLSSLDTFRGMALCIMIFVNYGGGGYWFFNHSAWNGLTLADLVFPWFIWIMGTSMALSGESRGKVSFSAAVYKIFRRSCILFALGLIVSNGVTTADHLRVMGVLQRFAVSYFFVAMLVLCCSGSSKRSDGPLALLLDFKLEWTIIFALMAAWLAVTFKLHVPGCPTGYLGPGGLADDGKHPHCTGGAAGYIDRKWLGVEHLDQSPTCQPLYKCGAHDPEGLLGCLTSIIMCYLGLQAGRVIAYYKEDGRRLRYWVAMAIIWGGIATGLCGGTQNGGWLPVNKNLWSLSFVFALSSMAYILLSISYYLVDVWKLWNGAPFVYVGMNSILVYFSSEVLQSNFPFRILPNDMWITHAWILWINIQAVAIYALAAYYCHYNKFYLKI